MHLKQPDCEKLIELYTELEFKSWIADVEREAKRAGQVIVHEEPAPPAEEQQYETILDQARFDVWLKNLTTPG